jgi:SAM-dependent methyltransferase
MKHNFGPNAGAKAKQSGHPVMFGRPKAAADFVDFPEGGGYPHRFLSYAYELMEAVNGTTVDPDMVLHLCSGSVQTGVRVDIRPEKNPDIVADCRNVPLPDESFDWILADPPYSVEYAKNLYGTDDNYPKPGEIVKEAMRLLRPGGLLGILHFQVPMIRKPAKIVNVYGVTTGSGYAIRAWTLIQKSSNNDLSHP